MTDNSPMNASQTSKIELADLDLQGYSLIERLNGIALMQDPVRADIVRYAAQEIDRLRTALEFLYDKWENGDPCFEDPETSSGSLGNAFKLSEQEERAILALIPRQCTGASPIPHETKELPLPPQRYRPVTNGSAFMGMCAVGRPNAWGGQQCDYVQARDYDELLAYVTRTQSQPLQQEPKGVCTQPYSFREEGDPCLDPKCPIHRQQNGLKG